MKRVLIGICGIGNGHINRQINVINLLMSRNVEIVVATTKNKINTIKSIFPNIKIVAIDIPWISCTDKGINFADCLLKYKNSRVDQFESFLKFSIELQNIFNKEPQFDLVISDYEPNVIQYAYATGTKVICMEQQSKFLYIENYNIENYSINEDIIRLKYFAPKVDYRIISSFFKINVPNDNVYILPPIIKPIVREYIDVKKGIVYFSPYSDNKTDFIQILEMLKYCTDITFVIYTNIEFDEYKGNNNFVFKPFGLSFDEDFSNAYFVISSSGHQLISESLYGNLPMLLFPLDTYEQHYNCLMVEKYNLGHRIREFSENEFKNFYENIPHYIENIKKYKQENWNNVWYNELDKIFDMLL